MESILKVQNPSDLCLVLNLLVWEICQRKKHGLLCFQRRGALERRSRHFSELPPHIQSNQKRSKFAKSEREKRKKMKEHILF